MKICATDSSKVEENYTALQNIHSEIADYISDINTTCLKRKKEEQQAIQEKNTAENEAEKKKKKDELDNFLKEHELLSISADLNIIKKSLRETKQDNLLSQINELAALAEKNVNNHQTLLKTLGETIRNLENFEHSTKQVSSQNKQSDLAGLLGQQNTSLKSNNPINLNIPKDNLPDDSKFTLYDIASQKYLSIKYWEDSELGKQEAARLKATLCVCTS